MTDASISQRLRALCPVCQAPRLDPSRITCSDQCEVCFEDALNAARAKLPAEGTVVQRVQRCVFIGGEFDGYVRLLRDGLQRCTIPRVSASSECYLRMTVGGAPTRIFAHEGLTPLDIVERLAMAYERRTQI